MTSFVLWPLLTILAAGLQIIRNSAQRSLTGPLGLWGATYVRFLYGLPFAALWCAAVVVWRGPDGGASLTHLAWASLGGVCQIGATALLLAAMRDRAFAAANALQKTEVLGAALVGLVVLGDQLGWPQWAGMAIASLGVGLIAASSDPNAARAVTLRAGACGIGAGLLFSISSVSYRAAGLAWGEDVWVGAAATLVTTLTVQTLLAGALLWAFRPAALKQVLAAWRPSLIPGASGAIASALLFTAFVLGPSAGAVKAVQLVDVLMAWGVSGRIFKERLRPLEAWGASLTVVGVLAVLLG